MREILFRGKRTLNGDWIEGLLWKKKYNYNRIFISYFPYQDDYEETYSVCPKTIGQYTGLTDKNGKKIFEGDIVKAKITENKLTHTKKYEGIYTVKYHDKYCYFYLAKQGNNLLFDGNWDYFLSNIEVIGNIHDNPELLKECEGK